jgi:selenide,water dikinase
VKETKRKTKHLVLVGGGHAHVEILRRWRMLGPRDLQLTLISPDSETLYSGMLPGLVAKHYREKDVVLDLHYNARKAGATFIRDQVVSLVPEEKKLVLKERPPLHYDVVSFDIGSRTKRPEFLPASDNILATRPFPVLLKKLSLWDSEVEKKRQQIVAVGSGAAGFELILALKARYRGRNCFFSLVDSKSRLSKVQLRILREEGVEVLQGQEVREVKQAGSGQLRVSFMNGEFISADKLLWAAGPEAHPVFGSLKNRDGFFLVNPYLQAIDHPEIFGAGDCIAHEEHPWVERAGVYAVREAPILFQNLLVAITKAGSLKKYSPQRRFLKILNTSRGDAILDRKPFHFSAGWVWPLKEYIDIGFMNKYRPERVKPLTDPDCGGCGGKIGSDTLCRVLEKLNPQFKESSDDVAFVEFQGKSLAATVDEFKDFGVDPYLFGKIAAVGAASDMYAKNLKPEFALSVVHLPKLAGKIAEDFLCHYIAGGESIFKPEGIKVVGGQTNESDGWSAGFSLFGSAEGKIWRKGPPKVGDVLVLTKPLGSGIILAAAMQEASVGREIDLCLAKMSESSAGTAKVLSEFSPSAATDVTGFSFLGHLKEMLEKGGLGAEIQWKQIPFYQGAEELFAQGYRSRMNALNERAFPIKDLSEMEKILYTPETAGGILAAVPESDVQKILTEIPGARVVGKVTSSKEIRLIR